MLCCSPRISARPPVPLNSSASSPLVQLGEASDYWHKQVVNRTRCRRHATAGPPLAACLLSLNASELIAAQPPNWHPDAFGFGVFDSTYQYAPLLLIDGEGGVLPEPYVDASGGAPARILDVSVPLILGSTAEEGDFAPTDDVRNSSRAELGAFVTSRLRRFIDEALVMKLVDHYVKDHASSPFEPQRIYSEMVADATVVRCSRISARPPVPLNPSASSPLARLGMPQLLSRPELAGGAFGVGTHRLASRDIRVPSVAGPLEALLRAARQELLASVLPNVCLPRVRHVRVDSAAPVGRLQLHLQRSRRALRQAYQRSLRVSSAQRNRLRLVACQQRGAAGARRPAFGLGRD